MSSNLEFTVTRTTCDSCRLPASAGFYHLHNDTPVLFDCTVCAGRFISREAIEAAIEAHKERAFTRMEAAAAA